MDATHFDRLARSLTALGTRRALLAALSALPVLGSLLAGLDPADTQAYRRRKRRKRRHQHRNGNNKRNHKGNGKNKGKGPDDPCLCDVCETCQNDGSCSAPCDGVGCCAGDSCAAGTEDTACGSGGATCVACSGATPQCVNGTCMAPCSATNPCPSGLCCTAGRCVATCPICQMCSSGQCVAVPNNTVGCDGVPLLAEDNVGLCAQNIAVGICVDGACSCFGQVYDPTGNTCLCTAGDTANCAANSDPSQQCCNVTDVCTEAGALLSCVPCS